MVLPVAVTPYKNTSPVRANARPMRAWLVPPISGMSTTAGVAAGRGDGSGVRLVPDDSAGAFRSDRTFPRLAVGTAGRRSDAAIDGTIGGMDGAAAGVASDDPGVILDSSPSVISRSPS